MPPKNPSKKTTATRNKGGGGGVNSSSNVNNYTSNPPPLVSSSTLYSSPLGIEKGGSDNHHYDGEDNGTATTGLWSFLKRKDMEVSRALAVDDILLVGELKRRHQHHPPPLPASPLTNSSTSAATANSNDAALAHSHHLRRVFPGRSETLRHSGAPTIAEATLKKPRNAHTSTSWLHYALERFAKKVVALFDIRSAAQEEIDQTSPTNSEVGKFPELIFARPSATLDPYLHGAVSFPIEWNAIVRSSVPPEHQEDLGDVVHLFQFVAFQVAAAEKRHRQLQVENDALRKKLASGDVNVGEETNSPPTNVLEEAAAEARLIEAATTKRIPSTLQSLDEVITNTTLRSVFLHQTQLYRESLATLVAAQQEELISLRQAKGGGARRSGDGGALLPHPSSIMNSAVEYPELYVAAQLGALAVGESIVSCDLMGDRGRSSPSTYLATGSQALCDTFHGGRHIPHRHSLPSVLQTVATAAGCRGGGIDGGGGVPYRMFTPNTSRDTMAQDIVGAVLGYAGVEVGLGASGKMTPVTSGVAEGGGGGVEGVSASSASCLGITGAPLQRSAVAVPPIPVPPFNTRDQQKGRGRRKERDAPPSPVDSESKGTLQAESSWLSDGSNPPPPERIVNQPTPLESFLPHDTNHQTTQSNVRSARGGATTERGGAVAVPSNVKYSGHHVPPPPLSYMNQANGSLVALRPTGPVPNASQQQSLSIAPTHHYASSSQPLTHRTTTSTTTTTNQLTPNPPRGKLVDLMPPQSLTARLVRNNTSSTSGPTTGSNASSVTTSALRPPVGMSTATSWTREAQESKRRREEMISLERQLYEYTSNFPSRVSQNVYGSSGGNGGGGVHPSAPREGDTERAKIRDAIKRHNDLRLGKGIDGSEVVVMPSGSSSSSNPLVVDTHGTLTPTRGGHHQTTHASGSRLLPTLISPRQPPPPPHTTNTVRSNADFSKVVAGDKSELDNYLKFLDGIAPPVQVSSSLRNPQ